MRNVHHVEERELIMSSVTPTTLVLNILKKRNMPHLVDVGIICNVLIDNK
jgi:hypothetical protein